jgi:hypothetical protein
MKLQSVEDPSQIIKFWKCSNNHVPEHFEKGGDHRELIINGEKVIAYANSRRTVYAVVKILGVWFYTADDRLITKTAPERWNTSNRMASDRTGIKVKAKRRSAPVSEDRIKSFHLEAITILLEFLKKFGIENRTQLNQYNGRALLDVPLWKLLETRGKYGSRYISEGVLNLERTLGKKVHESQGSWPERLLVQHFGPAPANGWSKNPSYCCQLEHVSQRSQIIDLLLREPGRASEILAEFLIGCVVLKEEHKRLGDSEIVSGDPWLRYRMASPPVRVWDRKNEEWVNLGAR